MRTPETYLDTPVPEHIRVVWRTWVGMEWRLAQHFDRGHLYPPDQRFGVDAPAGLCSVHRRQWRRWRDKRFRGQSWPGPFPNGGWRSADGFREGRQSLETEWEQHRRWWDEKSIEQMQAVESVCLSGRSRQCAGVRHPSGGGGMTWTQPICEWCLRRTVPAVSPCAIRRYPRICCHCGATTTSGLYIRIDPASVPYPSED